MTTAQDGGKVKDTQNNTGMTQYTQSSGNIQRKNKNVSALLDTCVQIYGSVSTVTDRLIHPNSTAGRFTVPQHTARGHPQGSQSCTAIRRHAVF